MKVKRVYIANAGPYVATIKEHRKGHLYIEDIEFKSPYANCSRGIKHQTQDMIKHLVAISEEFEEIDEAGREEAR